MKIQRSIWSVIFLLVKKSEIRYTKNSHRRDSGVLTQRYLIMRYKGEMKLKKHRMSALLAVCVLAVASLTGGCSGQEAATKTDAAKTTDAAETETTSAASEIETVSAADETEPEIDPETMDIIKYNIYVEMNNYMIDVLDNIDNYYMVVEYADEFAFVPDSGYDYKFGIVYLNTDIIDDALTVASMEPAYEKLDELAKEVAEPMRALMEGFNKINESYDFADNQYAKAKEYHSLIQENVEDFATLAYEFMDEVDIMGNEQMAATEAKMLEEGNLIIYNSSHAITIGNQILDECYAQGIDDSNLTELDLTNIRTLYDELAATVAAYDEAVSDNNQLMKESLSTSAPFDGLLNSLVQSVEWMIKQVESGRPIEDTDLAPLGSMAHIHSVLSQCIDRYNTVFVD